MKFSSLIPELTVLDIKRTKHFYVDVLNFNIKPFRELKLSNYRNGDEYIVQKEFLVQDPDGYLLRFTD